MSTTVIHPHPALILDLGSVIELDDERLFALCHSNRDLRIERRAEGGLEIMSPAGGRTAGRNAEIIAQLLLWARRDRRGQAFDSSGGFILPNGAMRSPDAAWIERARLRDLAPEQKEKFLPLCPTFVVELRSPSDALKAVEAKMDEYIAAGALLGWLIDPLQLRVHIYRRGSEVEILEAPATVSGDPDLPGLVMEMAEIWNPSW